MNDRDEIEPGDDPEIVNALSKLRGIEPPTASKSRNRGAVAAALRSLDESKPTPSVRWWRRSIPVPLPLAACVLLAFMLVGVVALRNGTAQNAQVQPAEQAQTGVEKTDSSDAETRPALTYRASATYLCGIGQIKSTRGYFFTEHH